MKYGNEVGVNDATINAAKEVLRTLSDEELQTQQKQIVEQLNAIPHELMRLAQQHERIQNEVRNAALLSTLTGAAGSDLAELERIGKAIADQRRQRRTDEERLKTMNQLVNDEINYRAKHRLYMATQAQIPGWKEQYTGSVPVSKEALARTIALYCHTQGGLHPQNIKVMEFVPNVLGDIQRRAGEIYDEMKVDALTRWDNGLDKQAAMAEKAAANAKAGIERKRLIQAAMKEGKSPAELAVMLGDVPGNTEMEVVGNG
jgi:hypothetical protein